MLEGHVSLIQNLNILVRIYFGQFLVIFSVTWLSKCQLPLPLGYPLTTRHDYFSTQLLSARCQPVWRIFLVFSINIFIFWAFYNGKSRFISSDTIILQTRFLLTTHKNYKSPLTFHVACLALFRCLLLLFFVSISEQIVFASCRPQAPIVQLDME